jgi:hypothetical protein
MIRISIFILLAIFLLQCKKKKDTAITPETSANTEVKKDKPLSELMTIHGDLKYEWPGSTDPFDVLETRIKGDTLTVTVQYGGGCEPHDFQMYQNMRWMKSMPPQLNLFLEHESNNDMCRALITQDLHFDLSTCRYNSGKSVILILNGDREKKFEYKY